jgi:hypothetical protein
VGGSKAGSEGGVVKSLVALLPPVVAVPADVLLDRVGILFGQFAMGARVLVAEPWRLYPVFVRGGDIQSVSEGNLSQTIYLTVTEAAPVAGGVAAVGAAIVTDCWRSVGQTVESSVRDTARATVDGGLTRLSNWWSSATGTADVFLLGVGAAFLLMFIPRLPLHAQLTVRYLLPLYPLAVYTMARSTSLHRVFGTYWRGALWTWAGGVLVGAQLFVVTVAVGSLGRGEAVQVHALAGLAVAAVFAALAAASVLTDRFDRATAVAGGLAAALGTDFILLSGLVYFQYGQYALPAAGWVADLLATA